MRGLVESQETGDRRQEAVKQKTDSRLPGCLSPVTCSLLPRHCPHRNARNARHLPQLLGEVPGIGGPRCGTAHHRGRRPAIPPSGSRSAPPIFLISPAAASNPFAGNARERARRDGRRRGGVGCFSGADRGAEDVRRAAGWQRRLPRHHRGARIAGRDQRVRRERRHGQRAGN